MKEWANQLQLFFISGGNDERALKSAIEKCDDAEVREFLCLLPQPDPGAAGKINPTIKKIAKLGMRSEANLLIFVDMLPVLISCENAHLLPEGLRPSLIKGVNQLIGNCRSNNSLKPSFGFLSYCAGLFYLNNKKQPFASIALFRAHRAFAALYDVEPLIYGHYLVNTLGCIGNLHGEMGKFPSALKAFKKARKILSDPIFDKDENNKGLLARVINDIGETQRRAGDIIPAHETFLEALKMYEKFSKKDKQDFEDGLANTLGSLGNTYSVMKDTINALGSYEEALEIFSRLAVLNPHVYKNRVAKTLNNIGGLQVSLHAIKPAQKNLEEARDIYLELEKLNPQFFGDDFAIALNNLGSLYKAKRDFPLAHSTLVKSLNLKRKVMAVHSHVDKSGLAITLRNLAQVCYVMNKFCQAGKGLVEAKDILEELTKENSEAYANELAKTYAALGEYYYNNEESSLARKFAEKAQIIFSKLSDLTPQIYNYDYVKVLNISGRMNTVSRNYSTARKELEEAKTIYKILIKQNPDVYPIEMVENLENLGNFYVDIREFVLARVVLEEALDVRCKFAKADPTTYNYDLVKILGSLGDLYMHTDEFELANSMFVEARRICEILFKSEPTIYAVSFSGTLNNLGNLYRVQKNDDHFSVITILEEAKDICSGLAKENPKIHGSIFAATLYNLACAYVEKGEFDDALIVSKEARDIYVPLAEGDLDRYGIELTSTLCNLGCVYHELSEFSFARSEFEKAVKCSESFKFDDSEFHLAKGAALAAYRYLLGETCGVSERAFSFAAAMRDGTVRSCDLGMSDLKATQEVLGRLDEIEGRPHAVFVPTAIGKDDKLTMGLITSKYCKWWSLPFGSWTNLLAEDVNNADNPARYALAHQIWEELPEELRNAFSPNSVDSCEILISGDSYFAAFPWELLRFGDGESDFLGLHKALPRIGSILAPSLEKLLKGSTLGGGKKQLAVIAPHTTGAEVLTGVLIEAEAIKKRVSEIGGDLVVWETGEAANDEMMRKAIAGSPAILYFSGHGGVVSSEEVLLLHSELQKVGSPKENISYFGGYQLNTLAQAAGGKLLFSNETLVILNSCDTGRTREYGGRREDLVQAFLNNGAGAVIASAIPVFDSVGEELGKALFSDESLEKGTIGQLIVEARRQLATGICKDIKEPTWGAWGMTHLHGNASAIPPFYVTK